MQTHATTEQKLLDTVRFAVEQALSENIKELNRLWMHSPIIMSEQSHKLEHSLEAENHLLRTISSRLSAYQRAVEKSSELRSLAFQERVSSGDAENDQAIDPQAIAECFQCGAEVKRNG